MTNQAKKTQVTAEWTFVYLKTLMREAPISVKALAQLSGVAEPTITRARAGKALKKETVIKMFDVLCKIERLEGILGNRQSEFLVKKGAKNIIDINKFIVS